MTYAFATSGGTPARAGVNPTAGSGLLLFRRQALRVRLLRLMEEDQTDFDAAKIPAIKKACRPVTTSCG
jgi:hypothetical protein